MPAAKKLTTTVSTKGQVVLPREARERAGFTPGSKLTVEVSGDEIILRPQQASFERLTVDDVYGMLKYDGPPVSIEDMNRGVDEYFRTTWGREYDDRD